MTPSDPLPRLFACPTCGALPPEPCGTPTGYAAATHRARWHAAGVNRPDYFTSRVDSLHGQVIRIARTLYGFTRHPAAGTPAARAAFWRDVFRELRGKEDCAVRLASDEDVETMRRLARRMTAEAVSPAT